MTEKEKNSDRMLQELIQEAELMEVPSGINEKIMQQVRELKIEEKKSPNFLRPAWILLLLAVIILPFFIKLIPGMINRLYESDTISFSASNFSFVLMVLFAGALLLIAEQLVRIGFMKS